MPQQVQLEDFLIELHPAAVSRVSAAPPDFMISVPVEFVHAVARHLRVTEKVDTLLNKTAERCSELNDEVQTLTRQLAEAQQPRPIEQAFAVLAQAWQSAVKPVEPERVAMPDVLLEAQRAGWDAHAVNGSVLPDADNPWPSFTPLWRSWREGWLMAQNDEARP